jgi:Flp pilus assembly protein TadB
MEFLLLWADDLDDVLGALRHIFPRLLGLFLALGLFAATGLALLWVPHLTLAALAVVLSASLFETVRRRRARLDAQRTNQ